MTASTDTAPLHLLHAEFESRARPLRLAGILTDGDLLIVDAVAPRFGETDPEVLLGLALAVRAPRQGHVGLRLEPGPDPRSARSELSLSWVEDWTEWRSRLLSSPLVGGPEDSNRPFVRQDLDGDAVLLLSRRLYREQERLASALHRLAASSPNPPPVPAAVEAGIERLFDTPDSQGARAVRRAANGCLTVVSGGPGTGKTYSIKRLLALLVEWSGEVPLRIELAAPTGKAAIRMGEALNEDLAELSVSDPTREALASLQPRTLHRLLGMRSDGGACWGPESPLAADLVVVDEASMVDLRQMRLLVEAIPPGARLVLLGDPDQLASVEAGSVLADLVRGAGDQPGGRPDPSLADTVVAFTEAYRFRRAPALGALVGALQEGSVQALDRAVDLLCGRLELGEGPRPERLQALGAAVDGRPSPEQARRLAAPYLSRPGFAWKLAELLRSEGPDSPTLRSPQTHRALLEAFGRYRILAVHRRGGLGVSGLEHRVEEAIRRKLEQAVGELAHGSGRGPAKGGLPVCAGHWLGRPILIAHNAYDIGLMNGDTGLVLPGPEGLVFSMLAPGSGVDGLRLVPLSRLPGHTGALAMTVHKSQGSQFEQVAVVLSDADSPLQTRELVYTAITRSSGEVAWLGREDTLRLALARRAERASGLSPLLAVP